MIFGERVIREGPVDQPQDVLLPRDGPHDTREALAVAAAQVREITLLDPELEPIMARIVARGNAVEAMLAELADAIGELRDVLVTRVSVPAPSSLPRGAAPVGIPSNVQPAMNQPPTDPNPLPPAGANVSTPLLPPTPTVEPSSEDSSQSTDSSSAAQSNPIEPDLPALPTEADSEEQEEAQF